MAKRRISPARRGLNLEDENSLWIHELDKKRAKIANVYYFLSFSLSLLYTLFALFFYDGYMYEVPNFWGLFVVALLFYFSASFMLLSVGKVYRRKYLSSITFCSLSFLMWFSSFALLPIRYGLHVLPEVEWPNLRGAILSFIFSGVGIYPLILVDKTKRAFLERRSQLSIVIAAVYLGILILMFPFGIRSGIFSKESLPLSSGIIVGFYMIFLIAHLVLSIVFKPNVHKAYLYVNLAFIIAIEALLLAFGIIGYSKGDHISLRISYVGIFFSLYMSVEAILYEKALYTMMVHNLNTTGIVQDEGV